MPVYLFALALTTHPNPVRTVISFLIIHLLIYPASNGYNSYFDKDEKSIGGLKNPPPVDKELYRAALLFDAIGVIVAAIVLGLVFALMLLVYGLVSKAYSHPAIRLKKYAIGGWLTAGFFQGFFTLIMSYIAITGDANVVEQPKVLLAGLLSSVMLWGNYPMTQVYQHDEDQKHGDYTMSRMLGIRGTFIFVQAVFAFAALGFFAYFRTYFSIRDAIAFLIALAPTVSYFMYWFALIWRDESRADFSHTMALNFISSTGLNLFFLYLFFWGTHAGQGLPA